MVAFSEKKFKYALCDSGAWQNDGTYKEGAVSVRTVSGTVQAMNFKECLSYSDGSRNSGYVKIYSDERLEPRERGEGSGGFVMYGGELYRITSEQAYINGIMSHWKYVAGLVPANEIPAGVLEAFE